MCRLGCLGGSAVACAALLHALQTHGFFRTVVASFGLLFLECSLFLAAFASPLWHLMVLIQATSSPLRAAACVARWVLALLSTVPGIIFSTLWLLRYALLATLPATALLACPNKYHQHHYQHQHHSIIITSTEIILLQNPRRTTNRPRE